MSVATVGPDVAPELGQIKQELLDARERARRLSEGLSDTLWGTPPAPGKWSIAECVIHLNITSERYVPIIDDAIREGREMGVKRRRRCGVISWDGCRPGARTALPDAEEDDGSRSCPRASNRSLTCSSASTTCRASCWSGSIGAQGLPLERLHVVSPFNARVKYNLYSASRLIPVHQRRHLWQAEQVRACLQHA